MRQNGERNATDWGTLVTDRKTGTGYHTDYSSLFDNKRHDESKANSEITINKNVLLRKNSRNHKDGYPRHNVHPNSKNSNQNYTTSGPYEVTLTFCFSNFEYAYYKANEVNGMATKHQARVIVYDSTITFYGYANSTSLAINRNNETK